MLSLGLEGSNEHPVPVSSWFKAKTWSVPETLRKRLCMPDMLIQVDSVIPHRMN